MKIEQGVEVHDEMLSEMGKTCITPAGYKCTMTLLGWVAGCVYPPDDGEWLYSITGLASLWPDRMSQDTCICPSKDLAIKLALRFGPTRWTQFVRPYWKETHAK